MNDYYSRATALRQQVAEIDDNYFNPMLEYDYSDTELANKLWLEHVELLKLVYPKPDPQEHIQVTILDTYYDDAVVLTTSFADINQYNRAYTRLCWDYELVSSEVGVCECCDEHYLVKDGCQDKDGRGFCKQGCLEEDQFERQMPTDDGEHDLFYDYYFPDGDPYDRKRPSW